MPASQELKDILFQEYQAGVKAVFEQKIDAAYDSGFNNAPPGEPGTGIPPEQVQQQLDDQKAQLKQAFKDLVVAHDANIQTDVDLQNLIDQL